MADAGGDKNTPRQRRDPVLASAQQEFINLLASKLSKVATEKAQGPLKQLCKNLPSEADEIRKLPFYPSMLQAVQWQRDNYLVGNNYAEARRKTREKQLATPVEPLVNSTTTPMPYDPNALGSVQISKLGSWFIPSSTVQAALLPIVVGLPSGALREPILNATVNAVPLAQPLVDQAVKNSLLTFMSNPDWRQVIKTRTKGYISSNPESNTTSDGA